MHFESNDTGITTICGEALRPIPDQEWVCVGHPTHDDEHLALDGTRW